MLIGEHGADRRLLAIAAAIEAVVSPRSAEFPHELHAALAAAGWLGTQSGNARRYFRSPVGYLRFD
jgi:hypothetical protein